MTRLFAFHCRDGENAAALRERHLQAHLDHIEAHIEGFAVAGPLKRDEETVGSLIVVKADDEIAARAFFETDPYFAAGIWQAIRVDELRAVAGDWASGVAWN
ncbi:YciI family protein [Aurantiacibacter aquimixticola]|uniref:YCII-related domain-containing protein n=1 Tax=Aurantiacibacter aquimixticola TaxID=1958945 RepID=A0A419RWA2_9SPHN|nr:YciI family protein [Aurantiacibacter aquimixticola]RJY10061.1 hypothetical protein D6201_12475 [Aurantiacibacter aquimixticola]